MNVMKSIVSAAVLGLSLIGSSAFAATYTEDFEEPFSAWKSGVIATNSDLANIYEKYGWPDTFRGNNPDGLWIRYDTWNFAPSFGASLTQLSFDVATYITTLTIYAYDSGNNLLSATPVAPTFGATTDPGTYIPYSVSSTTGILRILFGGVGTGGNTSIDNIVATTDPLAPVPLPAALPLFASGLTGLGAMAWRKRRKAAAAA